MSTEEEVTRLAGLISGGCNTEDSAWYILETNIVIDKASLPEVTMKGEWFYSGAMALKDVTGISDVAQVARNNAASYLAIAAHIESAQSAEKVAAEKLTERRDELAREFWHQQGVERYAQLSKDGAQLAVDHIIGLESRA